MLGREMDAFDAWVQYLFDRPPEDLTRRDPWYRRDADEPPREWTVRYAEHDEPVATAERIRRLFSSAGTVLGPYSDHQVAHGLQVIVNGSIGGLIVALADPRVPVALRTTALRSIVTLFAEVFAPRLPDSEESTDKPLGDLCFMFWDVIALGRGDEDTKLDVLEDTLALDSLACQRAALHGLGHLHMYEPTHVPEIVDRWLQRRRDAPAELLAYARTARDGMVM
jgi:hypothetical protein